MKKSKPNVSQVTAISYRGSRISKGINPIGDVVPKVGFGESQSSFILKRMSSLDSLDVNQMWYHTNDLVNSIKHRWLVYTRRTNIDMLSREYNYNK